MPMVYTIISAVVWLCAPVVFTPLPGFQLLWQDIRGLVDFITAPLPHDTGKEAIAQKDKRIRNIQQGLQLAAGLNLPARTDEQATEDGQTSEGEMTPQQIMQYEKATLRKPNEMRALSEWGFTQELHEHRSRAWKMRLFLCLWSTLQAFVLLVLVNGNILDHLYPFLFVFVLRWIITVISLLRDSNNILSLIALLSWLAVPFIDTSMVGDRGGASFAEIFIALFVFVGILRTARHWFLLLHCGAAVEGPRQDQVVRYAHYFFCSSDIETVVALIVLCVHVCVALVMIAVESLCCCCFKRGAHTWWLLNKNVSEPTFQKEKRPFMPNMTVRAWKDKHEVVRARDSDAQSFLGPR